MNTDEVVRLADWIIGAGLEGASEPALLSGFCRHAVAIGIPLAYVVVIIDTLHPILEGRAFRWRVNRADEAETIEYGSTREGEAAERWQQSPFYRLLQSGESKLRLNLAAADLSNYSTLDDMRAEGMVDYMALIHRFAPEGTIGEMDCVYSAWATDVPGGFADQHLAALKRVSAPLGLAVKSASLARINATLVETYLGRDPGRRVLGGAIARGVAEEINAVVWYSDLRSYTRISDSAPPAQIIPFLNDYADAIITAILEEGGDVLKLIGDGTLAIFKAETPERACACALAAAEKALGSVAALSTGRAAAGLPATEMYLGLHAGAMFYGNIGSMSRLDFTVVGPAVNEASRIAAMCRSLEQPLLLSSAFRLAAGEAARERLISVGRYALRGVTRPQELYTLELARRS